MILGQSTVLFACVPFISVLSFGLNCLYRLCVLLYSESDMDEKDKNAKYDDQGVDQEQGLKKLIDSEEESSEEEKKEGDDDEDEDEGDAAKEQAPKEKKKKKEKKEGAKDGNLTLPFLCRRFYILFL